MARLFITEREINFISDITKEITKDISGQKIYYYPISESKTLTNGVYNESEQKIFDNPISIDALVSAQYQEDTRITAFGVDTQFKIDVFLQYRDLADKGIKLSIGDYFSFSDIFYEITNNVVIKNIFGQAEYRDGVKITGTRARDSQFKAKLIGPTDITHTDPDAVQKTFVQQRGFAENSEGPTGDKRELVEQGVLEPPLTGPKEVSETGALADNSHYAEAFYGERNDR